MADPPPSAPPAAGTRAPVRLDLSCDVVTLTRALCDIASVSGQEDAIADAVEAALREVGHLRVERDENVVVARTDLGRTERVVLAGHLDTVPLTDPPNLPIRQEGDFLYGRGTSDMKGGVAVALRLAAGLAEPSRDVTYVFYDGEEVSSDRNGLGRIARTRPDLLAGDFAVLLEPTAEAVEGGCNGMVQVEVRTHGVAAHSARPWMGHNAIHDAAGVLNRLAAYIAEQVEVDGLLYREALNATTIHGGVAGNAIPPLCAVGVNYRFAPRVGAAAAVEHVREVFQGYDLSVTDQADGARPGLDRAAARSFVEALGLPVRAKEGWTDVARFSALGIPAVNFGPGDWRYAHADDERCEIRQLVDAERAMTRWLS